MSNHPPTRWCGPRCVVCRRPLWPGEIHRCPARTLARLEAAERRADQDDIKNPRPVIGQRFADGFALFAAAQ